MKLFVVVLMMIIACCLMIEAGPIPESSSDELLETAKPEVVCRQNMKRGQCRALIPRWMYDSHTGACTEFKYGGCGGNGNNFKSQEECQRMCGGI